MESYILEYVMDIKQSDCVSYGADSWLQEEGCTDDKKKLNEKILNGRYILDECQIELV